VDTGWSKRLGRDRSQGHKHLWFGFHESWLCLMAKISHLKTRHSVIRPYLHMLFVVVLFCFMVMGFELTAFNT
jgi:hypothetical protein